MSEHGLRGVARDSFNVCRTCDTRIVTGDRIRYSTRRPNQDRGLIAFRHGRWVHEECFGPPLDTPHEP